MIWVDLRDRYGITQLIFDEQRTDKTVIEKAKSLEENLLFKSKELLLSVFRKTQIWQRVKLKF